MSSHAHRRSAGRPKQIGHNTSAVAGSGGSLATRWGLGFALAILAFAAFAPALRAPFQFDDIDTIPGNASIRRLWPLSIPLTPPADIATTGRPVANLSFAVNHAINERLGANRRPGEPDPNTTFGYHLFNLLIHLASGALLFGIVRRTFRGTGIAEHWIEQSDTLAWVVTALWLLHPIQTDAVNYITQRTELLVSAFYLATLYGAIRGWESTDRSARLGWFACSIAASLLGMGSKEVMISAPLVVFLYDRAFRQENWRTALRLRGKRLAYYLLLAATGLWGLWHIVTGARAETVGFNLGVPWYEYLYSQAWAITHYLQLTLVPFGFVIDYGRDPVSVLRAVPGAVIVTALLVATIIAWRKNPKLGFLGAWFFLILAPSSSFVPIRTEIAAERRFHLAFAAVLVALAVGAITLARRLTHDRDRGATWRARLSPANRRIALIVACLALAALTFQRSTLFANPEALWRDAVAKVPTNPRAQHNLAMALLEQDPPRDKEAEAALRRAIEIDSTYLPAWPNLASVVGIQGNTAEERRLLEHVLKKSPHYVQAMQQLGFLLISLEKSAEALAPLEQLSAEAPSDEGFIALATAYNSLGRPVDAVVALRRAIQMNPDRADAMSYLGATLTEAGDPASAVPVLEEALAHGLGSAFVYASLGLAYAQVGRLDEGLKAAYEGAQRAGNDPAPLIIAGHALLILERPADADRVLAEAARLHARLEIDPAPALAWKQSAAHP